MKKKQPLVIAHRGGDHGPDNAIGTFKSAIKLKADMIELDVRKTKDGHLVVFHDSSIERITNGKGSVAHFKLSSLRRFRLFNDEPIPTLEQVFKAVGTSSQMLIELKVEGIELRVANLIKKYKLEKTAIICSFKAKSLAKIASLDPHIRLGLLMLQFNIKNLISAKKMGCECILPHHKRINPLFVELTHLLDLNIYPWTVDAAKRMRQLNQMGVDGIITNRLEELHKVLHSKDKKRLSFFNRLFSQQK